MVRDLRQAGGTSSAPAARSSSTEIKCGSVTDRLQELGLLGFQFHEQRQDMQDVEEFGGVFGEPMVGLDFSQFRGRPSVADDGAFAFLFAIAEPLRQDPLARDFVAPDGGKNMVDESLPDEEAFPCPIISDFVGHGIGIVGDGTILGDARGLVFRESGRSRRAKLLKPSLKK